MGTPAFGCPPLKALIKSSHEILAVVTGTDKPSGRGKKLTPTEVSKIADKNEFKTLKPISLKDDELYQSLKALQADLFVVVAFKILPERLFSLPKYGSINIHASLLPKYRGPAPINWVLINGEKETGLTSFFLKKKVDTGDIILQEKITIDDKDNYDSLYTKLSNFAGEFLLKTLDLIERKETSPLPQNDHIASTAPKISSFDALIDFGFPAEKVNNFIRGLSSKPGAYTYFRSKKLKVLSGTVESEYHKPETRPGTIIINKKNFIIQCANSAIMINSLIPEGKKQMDGISFINGFKPQPGEVLGELTQGS